MQLKGTQKRMIAIRTAQSSIFEEAYFVLRANIDNGSEDIIAEAEKIISDKDQKNEKSNKITVSRTKLALFCSISFLAGAVISSIFIIFQ